MTGMSPAALTTAHAIRWVKESRLPAVLSALRRASRTSTERVRKLVAVGIDLLSSMKLTSVAAGPRIGLTWASAGAGAGAPLPSSAASTSSFSTRPRGPDPRTEFRSTPSAVAMRAAIGVALAAPLPSVAGARSGARRSSAGCAGGCTGPSGASAPAAIRHRMLPTETVASASARISAIVPAAGEGTSASTLSVEISTSGSSTATASPTATFHSSTVPSATESPISGKATSTSSSEGGSGASSVSVGAGASPLTSISPRTAPTETVESGAARIFLSVPAAGAGTSASTLSVETSTSGSSASTWSPSCLRQSRMVPSVTDSPIWGIVICTVVARVVIRVSRVVPPPGPWLRGPAPPERRSACLDRLSGARPRVRGAQRGQDGPGRG